MTSRKRYTEEQIIKILNQIHNYTTYPTAGGAAHILYCLFRYQCDRHTFSGRSHRQQCPGSGQCLAELKRAGILRRMCHLAQIRRS
jgi:hypothetical protein